MNFTYIIIGLVLIATILLTYQNYNKDISYIKSRIDGRKYLVYNLEHKQVAADILALTRKRLVEFCENMKLKYRNDPRISRMVSKFNPDNIVETEPGSKYTSYSINKGEKMVLCLRSRDGQQRLVKENVIMFVALHEMAHIMTLSVGHTKEFWDNFEFILKEATAMGLYQHIDFNSDNYDYCGIKITDTPLKKK